ncbi:hypothetical protein GCM10028824_19810 [Hymenobacter segetis]|uniref:IPT/TIG domain-containing protein n=1 Tax=Hymenobacter segetis TaxID=2025509 RepID=A0ABU9LTE1_9BACT
MQKLLLLVLALLATTLGFAQTLNTYQLNKMMGTPVYGPREVAVDRNGDIYMIDGGGVTKLDSTGRCYAAYSATPAGRSASNAQTLGLDGAGNLYVCNYSTASGTNDFVRKYGPDGNLLLQFGSVGTGPGQFQEVHGMCVDAAGRVYIVDYIFSTPRLQCFDSQGTRLFEYTIPNATYQTNLVDVDVDPATGSIYLLEENFFVTKLTAAGQFMSRVSMGGLGGGQYPSRAVALLVAPNGELLITGIQLNIIRFNQAGTQLGIISPMYTSFSSSTRTPLARDAAGNIYATVYTHQIFSDHLFKLSPTGTLLKRWGNIGSLSHVRQDELGNVFILDNRRGEVVKYDAAGQEVLAFGSGRFSAGLQFAGLSLDALGNVYVLETSDMASDIQKFSPRGQFIVKFQSFGITQGYQRFSGLAVDAGGSMYVADYSGCCVRKLNPQGVFLSTMGSRGTALGQLYIPRAIAVDLRGNVFVADYDGKRVQKFSPGGVVLRQYGPSAPGTNPTVTSGDVGLDVDGFGNVYTITNMNSSVIFSADGSTQKAMPTAGTRLSVNRLGTRLITLTNNNDLVRFYTSTTLRPENLINGQIFNDLNGNCVKEPAEQALPGVVVAATPGNYYGISDENGMYSIATDTGRYTVQQLPAVDEPGRLVQQTCSTTNVVTFRNYGGAAGIVNFGNAVSTTAYLRVAIAANRRRRCARNTTTVTYANTGFAAAPSAQVAVTMPPEVILLTATTPYTRDAQGRYLFAVGTLQPNDGGTIFITDSVVCGNPAIRGLTVCTRATITPPNTYPTPPTWNRAAVTVQGKAQAGNQVRFVLRNTATAAMTDSLALRLYQNSELALQHRYRLAAGDSLVLRVPATRPVVRLEADQPTGHPTQRMASSTVEVSALGTAGQPNSDMSASPPTPSGPETAEDCQPIRDSYDPNDKQVVPTGTTAQHYTPTGVPLRYQVRFQNTGTDDAYRVEVVDTLAANLDLRTLHVLTASHPYRVAVSGHGRAVLTFTFENINLPPATRDAVGSNGFVQFSIQPKAGLPARELIENNADIFFDYNPPVRTNTTANRIYDVPLVVTPAVALGYASVLASPVLTQVVPAQGRAGTLVTLNGQRFATTLAGNTVRFNGVAAPVLSASGTTLTVRVPTGTSTGSVQVITGEGSGRSAQAFTVYQPPTLAPLAPAEGIPNATITLTGTEFAAVAAQDTVRFNGVAAVVQQASATALRVVVPANATTGKIRINTLGGQVESVQDFVVWYPPTLVSFSPTRGKAGDVVTMTGSNFAPAARNDVAFGTGAGTVVQATGTSLRVRVPASAQSGPIRVSTPGGASVSVTGFTFLPPPTITAFVPAQASVGEEVTLTGLNFLVEGQPDTIYFNGIKAAVLATTATSATVRVPKGALSGPLTMGGTGGRSASTTAFTVLDLSAADAIATYPNPAHGTVTLDWQRADFEVEQVRVYNALGQLVSTQDLSHRATPSLMLPFAPGQTGLHLLVIQTSRGPVLKRITLY